MNGPEDRQAEEDELELEADAVKDLDPDESAEDVRGGGRSIISSIGPTN